jgi:cold shock CspA family protein
MLAGKWKEIGDSSLQDALEAAFSAHSDGYRFVARGYTYEIDFSHMKQVNTSTKRERGLRRVPDCSAVSVSAVPKTSRTAPAKLASSKPTPVSMPASAVSVPSVAASSAPAVPAAHKISRTATAKVAISKPTPVTTPASAKATKVPAVPTIPVVLAPARLLPSHGCTIRRGRVKTVLKEKGYGFIVLDDSKELFFHVSIPGGDSVQGNDTVEVDVPVAMDRAGRMRAKQVRLLQRGSIYKQTCKNKCCVANGERHWEDSCPRGGSAAVTTASVVVAQSSAAAVPKAAMPKAAAPKSVPIVAAGAGVKAGSTTKANAVRLQNRYQMFADDDDDDDMHDGKTDDTASTDCS